LENGDHQWRSALSDAREINLDIDGRVSLPAEPATASYLLLNISSDQTVEFELAVGLTNATLILRPGSHDYLLRLGIWQSWWLDHRRTLRLETSAGINSIKLLEAD